MPKYGILGKPLIIKSIRERKMKTNTPTDNIIENINGITEWIKQSADAVGHFAKEQTPLYVQEYLNWYFWDYAINAIVLFLVFLIGLVMLIWALFPLRKSQIQKGLKSYDQWWCIPVAVAIFIMGMFGILMIDQAKEAVKVKVAPRVVVLDQAARIIKRIK